MDTTKLNILMCEKATEIHRAYVVRGEFYNSGSEVRICSVHHQSLELSEIWLPRQDQLQRMVLPKKYNSYWFVWKLNEFVDEHNAGGLTGNPSMEQLWLAFVMKEKYNKVWNGKDWIKCI